MHPSYFLDELTVIFSEERLAGYQKHCGVEDNIELLSRYLWNLALSESLYPLLQNLEIALRNRLYKVISAHYKNAYWLEEVDILYAREQQLVKAAIAEIRKSGKTVSPANIVTELNFGFWTSLFDRRYEHQQRLWPILLKSTFPHIPVRLRTRATLSKILTRIRHLRNRIYHYEPIWYWQDLPQQHQQIIAVMGWIQPSLIRFNNFLDRFTIIYQTGYQPFKLFFSETGGDKPYDSHTDQHSQSKCMERWSSA